MIFVIMAFLMDFKRLYGYAALVAIYMLLAETVSPSSRRYRASCCGTDRHNHWPVASHPLLA